MSSLSCGFVGLGSQGAPIARRIVAAGYPLLLWARRDQALEPFRDTCAAFATDIEQLAQHCNHIGICVTEDVAVKAVCEPLIANMAPGSLIAIHSTVQPETCRVLAERASRQGVLLVDAPVSGGAPAARLGRLTLMIGGSSRALTQARPVFDTFAKLVVHLGEVGAGQKAKILNNSLMAAHLGLAHRALRVAASTGLDISGLGELLKSNSGGSFALDVCLRRLQTGSLIHDKTLLEKIYLLGNLLGEHDPAFTVLRAAAGAWDTQAQVPV